MGEGKDQYRVVELREEGPQDLPQQEQPDHRPEDIYGQEA